MLVCIYQSQSHNLSLPPFLPYSFKFGGFPGGISGKEPTCHCRRCKRHGFSPWVGKIPWRRAWQPTPGFLTGKSHGQRSLVGYSPWGRKESDTTEATKQHDCMDKRHLIVFSKWPLQATWSNQERSVHFFKTFFLLRFNIKRMKH